MFVYGIDLLMTNNLFEISYYYFMGSGLIARGKPLLYLCIIYSKLFPNLFEST